MQSKSENAIVKASYGGKTRKWKLGGSSFSGLIDAVRNEFGIESTDLRLKYKDIDGDYIELANDEDLVLAVELEQSLNLVASNDSDDVPKSLADFRSALTSLISNATDLFNSLDTLSLPEKKPSPVNTRDAVSSPVKNEAVATIDPSVLDEVSLNDGPNGTVYESKPTFDNGIQSLPPKPFNQFNESGFSQPPVSNHLPQQPQAFCPPQTGGFGQHEQFAPPSSGFGQQYAPVSNAFSQAPSHPPQQQFAPPPTSFGQPPSAPSLGQQPGGFPPTSMPLTQVPGQQAPASFPPTSMPLTPASGFGQQPPLTHGFGQQPPVSNFGQQPPSNYPAPTSTPLPPSAGFPQQQAPVSSFGQQPPSAPGFGQPPSSFPPTSMPLPPSSGFGGQAPQRNPFQKY